MLVTVMKGLERICERVGIWIDKSMISTKFRVKNLMKCLASSKSWEDFYQNQQFFICLMSLLVMKTTLKEYEVEERLLAESRIQLIVWIDDILMIFNRSVWTLACTLTSCVQNSRKLVKLLVKWRDNTPKAYDSINQPREGQNTWNQMSKLTFE
jgi:hypothetical protein